MCLNAQPVGNMGGYSYLYLIDDTYGYGGIRKYKDYCPTLRSERSGLKIAEIEKSN